MNLLIISGNLGQDPEMRFTPTGKPVTNFSIAVNSRGPDNQPEPTWFNVICWEKLAEITNQYLHKGSKVLVEGRLKVRKYETKQGEPRFSLDVTANNVEFMDPLEKTIDEETGKPMTAEEFLLSKGARKITDSENDKIKDALARPVDSDTGELPF